MAIVALGRIQRRMIPKVTQVASGRLGIIPGKNDEMLTGRDTESESALIE